MGQAASSNGNDVISEDPVDKMIKGEMLQVQGTFRFRRVEVDTVQGGPLEAPLTSSINVWGNYEKGLLSLASPYSIPYKANKAK